MNKQTNASTSTSTTSVSQVTSSADSTTATTLCANLNYSDSAGAHICDLFEQESVCKRKLAAASNGQQMGAAVDSKFWWNKTRIHVALLGLTIAAVNCYAQATFCIAIVEMILPPDYVASRLDDLSQQRQAMIARPLSGNQTASGVQQIFDHLDHSDQSCPIELKYRDYYDSWRFPDKADVFISNNSSAPANSMRQQVPLVATAAPTSRTLIDVSNRFDWDASQQGLLLGAFAVGTAPLQVIGGRLAEIYGSKWVLLAGCIGTALTNLTIPYIAHFSFVLLLVNRVLMGIAQAGMEPGLMCLMADWLTPKEAGFFISMLLFAICMGFFLGSLCSTFILALGYGWPLAYYVSGGLNLFVGIIWYIYADSWPRASKYISDEELAYINHEQKRPVQVDETNKEKEKEKKLGQFEDIRRELAPVVGGASKRDDDAQSDLIDDKINVKQSSNISISGGGVLPYLANQVDVSKFTLTPQPPPPLVQLTQTDPINAPWLNILSTPSVWAFIICKISIRWCADVLANELPLYLANVLHLSIKINGLFNSMSTALFAISSFLTGWLANEIFVNQEAQQGCGQQVNKTRVRKLFQSVASFGSAICIILMTRYDCDIVFSMSMLLILSCCLVMGTGGELQIPYDMTSRYPGTLHGMACTLSVSGWLAPPLIGLVLADQPSSRHRWSIVWYSTAAINLIGGLVFVLFADASPKDFDSGTRAGPADNQNDDLNKVEKFSKQHEGAGKSALLSSSSKKADENLGQQRQQQQHQDQELLGYTNIALSNSSCENSPKSKHNNDYLLNTTTTTNRASQQSSNTIISDDAPPPPVFVVVEEGEEELARHQKQLAQGKGLAPAVIKSCDQDSGMHFDSDKLIKIRQLESSFIKPSGHNLDSPIDRDAYSIMLPYQSDNDDGADDDNNEVACQGQNNSKAMKHRRAEQAGFWATRM